MTLSGCGQVIADQTVGYYHNIQGSSTDVMLDPLDMTLPNRSDSVDAIVRC